MDMVPKPKGVKPVGCRWVFNLKYKSDGTMERHKARLAAKEYTQTFRIDYSETFAPVATMIIVWILLSHIWMEFAKICSKCLPP